MNDRAKKNLLTYASRSVRDAKKTIIGKKGKKFFLPFLLPSSQFLRSPIVCLTLVVCSASISVVAQTPLPVAKSRPVYDQCASLSNTSGGASAAASGVNDDVAKAIAALKEKDLKVREQAAALLAKSCDARA